MVSGVEGSWPILGIMKEESRRKIREFYAGVARLTGAVSAIFAVWFGGTVVVRLFSTNDDPAQPVVGALLAMLFCLAVALLLLSVRAKRPRDSRN